MDPAFPGTAHRPAGARGPGRADRTPTASAPGARPDVGDRQCSWPHHAAMRREPGHVCQHLPTEFATEDHRDRSCRLGSVQDPARAPHPVCHRRSRRGDAERLYAAQAQKRPGPAGRAVSEANFFVSNIGEKFIYAIPVFGILLVLASHTAWKFSQTWIWLALLLYVVAIGISHAILIPGHKKINALLPRWNRARRPPAARRRRPSRFRRSASGWPPRARPSTSSSWCS